MIGFEWDARKATANLRRHRVSFEEAATVFGDPLASVYEDLIVDCGKAVLDDWHICEGAAHTRRLRGSR